MLNEFNYEEIYKVLDLKIGKCRLSIAKKKNSISDLSDKEGHILVATKYKNTVTNYFAKKGIRAECIKLNGGKPVGIKLCVGHPWEIISIIKTMTTTKKYVDFITVDGAEGGTGAAPAEFTDHIGCPLKDAIVFVDNALVGANLRDRVKIGASGKVVSAFDIAHMCALGADWVNMARPFMFSIGCIQCRSCHTGECPTGIATMDPMRYRAIDIQDRSERAYNFHKNTIFVLKELLESVGVKHTKDLNRRHIVRRLSESEIRLADQIYPRAEKGELLKKGRKTVLDPRLNVYWDKVSPKSFNYIPGSI